MIFISFFVHLMSGVFLLLFAIQFMRVGIERQWKTAIRRSLSDDATSISLLSKGVFLGFAMQGGTAVMLLGAGLAGNQTISTLAAAMLGVGAELGSAIAANALSLPLRALQPLLLLVGAWLYLSKRIRGSKQIGRVILGLGLIFLALSLIREAVQPIGELRQFTSVMTYLNTDPVTAVLAGIALTIVMFSSLAAILTAAAIAGVSSLNPVSALLFVIGCNIGSALLPLRLLRDFPNDGQTVGYVVAALRVCVAIFVALIITFAGVKLQTPTLPIPQIMLFGHALLNALGVLIAPLAVPILVAQFGHADDLDLEPRTAFESDNPDIQVSLLKRKVHNMLETLSAMFEHSENCATNKEAIRQHETTLNQTLSEVRGLYANMSDIPDNLEAEIQTVLEFAIRLESSGDIIRDRICAHNNEIAAGLIQYSDEGAREISQIKSEIQLTLIMAQRVFWEHDVKRARDLVKQKEHVTRLEEASRRHHLDRVSAGNPHSLTSSDAHLEMIAALRLINSKLAAVGYAVLSDNGLLKKTRVKG